MKRQIKRWFHYVRYSNDNGFTMLEVIISFSIFCILASFLPLFFSILLNIDHVENRLQQFEFELFISQLNKEVQGCDYIDVRNGKLYMQSAGEEITVEKYASSVRRLVALRGHELLLQNVKDIKFIEGVSSILITVVDVNDRVYEDQLFPFLQVVDTK